MNQPTINSAFTDAVRYWESRRVIYNVGLIVIVIGYFVSGLPGSRESLSFDAGLLIFIMAVLANIAYSAAYIVDIFFQFTDFIDTWRKVRWILFALGFCFAAIFTRFFSMAMFLRFS